MKKTHHVCKIAQQMQIFCSNHTQYAKSAIFDEKIVNTDNFCLNPAKQFICLTVLCKYR